MLLTPLVSFIAFFILGFILSTLFVRLIRWWRNGGKQLVASDFHPLDKSTVIYKKGEPKWVSETRRMQEIDFRTGQRSDGRREDE